VKTGVVEKDPSLRLKNGFVRDDAMHSAEKIILACQDTTRLRISAIETN
jgi:hypothetical protein